MKRPELMWDASEPDHEALRNDRGAKSQGEAPPHRPDMVPAADLPEDIARVIPEDLLADIPPGDLDHEGPGQDLPPADLPPRGDDLPPPDLPPPDLPPDDLPGQPKPGHRR